MALHPISHIITRELHQLQTVKSSYVLTSYMIHQVLVSGAPVLNEKVRFLPIYITTMFHLTVKKFHSSLNEFLLSVKLNQEDFILLFLYGY